VLEADHGHDGYSAGVFVRQAAELSPETFLVLEEKEGVIGFSIGALVQHNTSRAWCLRLAIRKEYRGKGLGTRLFTALLEVLSAHGVQECFLTVSPHNIPARTLYENMGFEIVREEEGYFGEGEDRYMMKKNLPPQ
jgi:ribosomal-protein-alanine N-acetyltransferase